jgi:hypothetical protein
MSGKRIENIIIPLAILLGVVVFVSWLWYDPVKDFAANVPGMDDQPKEIAGSSELIRIGAHFERFAEMESRETGNWTQFRGGKSDNISREKIALINRFGKGGPKILWSVDLGEGHAAPVVHNGKVYLLDYDEKKKADALRCFNLENGQEIWRRWYNVHVKRNHGMSRTVPAVNDKYLVTMGPRCHVMCTDPNSGEFLWGIDLVKDYGTEVPFLVYRSVSFNRKGCGHYCSWWQCPANGGGLCFWKSVVANSQPRSVENVAFICDAYAFWREEDVGVCSGWGNLWNLGRRFRSGADSMEDNGFCSLSGSAFSGCT